MLDAIKHITDQNFFFQEDSAQVHFVCNTIQLSEMWFSRFSVLPGSAEAQVTWGGIESVFWLPTLLVTCLKIHSRMSQL